MITIKEVVNNIKDDNFFHAQISAGSEGYRIVLAKSQEEIYSIPKVEGGYLIHLKYGERSIPATENTLPDLISIKKIS